MASVPMTSPVDLISSAFGAAPLRDCIDSLRSVAITPHGFRTAIVECLVPIISNYRQLVFRPRLCEACSNGLGSLKCFGV